MQRGPTRSITLASLQEEVTVLSLSPLIISLSSCAAYCCARLFPEGERPQEVSAAPLPRSLADLVTFLPSSVSSPLSTALLLLCPPLLSVLWCTLSSLLSVPVFSSVPFGAQRLSPLHCLRSALPIAALSLMCYYRKTQPTGIPYLPTRALPSSPNPLPLPLFLSLSLSPSPLLSRQPMQQLQPDLGSSSPLPVSLISPSLCLLWLSAISFLLSGELRGHRWIKEYQTNQKKKKKKCQGKCR